jgi:protein TonB
MSPHVDILEQPDSLKRPFWYSVIFHVSVAGALALYAWSPIARHPTFGSPNAGGGIGDAVRVQPLINLPSRGGPLNPVASNSTSQVPETRAKDRPKPKAAEPKPNAISFKGVPKKPSRSEAAPPNKFRDKEIDRPSQLTSTVGRQLSNDMVSLPGGGRLGVGDSTPFGDQFGWYAKLLQDAVAKNWRTTGLDARYQTQPAVVTFRLLKDGSLAPGSVRVTQTSSNKPLDDSAIRAILDSAFPPLPQGFNRSQADVEFRFELRH